VTPLSLILTAMLAVTIYTVWCVLYCAMSAKSVVLWRTAQPGMAIALIVFVVAAIVSRRATVSEVAEFFRGELDNSRTSAGDQG